MSEYHHPNYVRVWAILVALLCVSVAGPFLGIPAVTLITADGAEEWPRASKVDVAARLAARIADVLEREGVA